MTNFWVSSDSLVCASLADVVCGVAAAGSLFLDVLERERERERVRERERETERERERIWTTTR
jgi:hypothetical protein